MNTGSGQNLNWFWKRWFFDNGVPDLAISRVTVQKDIYTILITNVGSKPIPINLTIYYKDGSTQVLHQNVSVWKTGNKTYPISQLSHKRIQKIELGDLRDPDVNKENNVWEAK